jgi:MFS family permease
MLSKPNGSNHFEQNLLPSMLMSVFSFVTAFTNFFLPIYFRNTLGFSGAQIGILFGAFAATAIMASLPVGLGTDRVTPKWIISTLCIMLALSAFGMSRIRAFSVYLVFFILFGLSVNGVRLALDALYLKVDPGNATGGRMGLYQGLRMVGITLGTAGGGYLLHRVHFSGALVVLSVCSLLLLFGTLLLPNIATVPIRLAQYRADVIRPRVLLFMGWLFLFSLHWGAELTSYALFLQDALKLSLWHMGLYMSAEFVALGISVWWCGQGFDRGVPLRSMAIGGLLLSGIGHVVMCVPVIYISLVARLVHGLGDGAVTIVVYVGMAKLFHLDRMGGNSGLVFLIFSIGSVVGSVIYGPLGQDYGYAMPLIISGMITFLITPIVYLLPKSV